MKHQRINRDNAIKTILVGGVITLFGQVINWFKTHSLFSAILVCSGTIILIIGIILMIMVAIKENDNK